MKIGEERLEYVLILSWNFANEIINLQKIYKTTTLNEFNLSSSNKSLNKKLDNLKWNLKILMS